MQLELPRTVSSHYSNEAVEFLSFDTGSWDFFHSRDDELPTLCYVVHLVNPRETQQALANVTAAVVGFCGALELTAALSANAAMDLSLPSQGLYTCRNNNFILFPPQLVIRRIRPFTSSHLNIPQLCDEIVAYAYNADTSDLIYRLTKFLTEKKDTF